MKWSTVAMQPYMHGADIQSLVPSLSRRRPSALATSTNSQAWSQLILALQECNARGEL